MTARPAALVLLLASASARAQLEAARAGAEAGFLRGAGSPAAAVRAAAAQAQGALAPAGGPAGLAPAPAAPEKAELGGVAPEFTLDDTSGKAVASAGFRGKVVLLDFWASWCGPCKAATDVMIEFHKTYGPKGLVVIGVNAFDGKTQAQTYLDHKARTGKKIEYPVLVDSAQDATGVAGRYGVQGLPTFVLIGADGKIISIDTGLKRAELEDRIREALKSVRP